MYKLLVKSFAILLLLSAAGLGHAATFTVNDTLDGVDIFPGDGVCKSSTNSCTLRAAVMESNALAGADSISLPAGFYTLAVGNIAEDAAAEGDLDILDDLTINGDSASTTTINGNTYLYRVISVIGSGDTIPTVEINNVTLSQGYDSDNGGLINNSGNLTLSNVILSDGNPTKFAVVNTGNLTIDSSEIRDNAFAVASTAGNVAIRNSTFSNNSSPSYGGAAYQHAGGIGLIENTTFTNNTSNGNGGALLHTSGRLTINNSTFAGNQANEIYTASANGGAIATTNGDLRISNCSFDNNIANGSVVNGYGGALYIDRVNDSVGIYNSTFTNNSAYSGGAIYSEGGYWNYFKRLTVDGNSASRNGGGLYLGKGTTTIHESIITNNSAANTGGGVVLGNTTLNTNTPNLQLSHNEISNNTADIAGGFYSSLDSVLVDHTTISDNTSTTDGGGIYIDGGKSSFSFVTVANNSTSVSSGSNIVRNSGTLNLSHSIIDNPLGGGDNCSGTVTSTGNNIVSDSSCNLGVTGDQSNTNPMLASLADNGGFTKTLALQTGSPAIDAGSSTYCDSVSPVDQRYFYRGDSVCDIGAYEAGSTAAQSGTLAFTSSTFSVMEGTSEVTENRAQITISRTGGSQGYVAVPVFTAGGTATPGSLFNYSSDVQLGDYADIPITWVEFNDGDSVDKTIEIQIDDDTTEEADETIALVMETAAFVLGNAQIGTSSTTLTIEDDDAPTNSNNSGGSASGGSSSGDTSSDTSGAGAFGVAYLLTLVVLAGFRRTKKNI